MWFNAETGMIRFGSDFTFSSGRATMRKNATDLISRVATILNSPEATTFEIVVMGHTDNIQPKLFCTTISIKLGTFYSKSR